MALEDQLGAYPDTDTDLSDEDQSWLYQPVAQQGLERQPTQARALKQERAPQVDWGLDDLPSAALSRPQKAKPTGSVDWGLDDIPKPTPLPRPRPPGAPAAPTAFQPQGAFDVSGVTEPLPAQQQAPPQAQPQPAPPPAVPAQPPPSQQAVAPGTPWGYGDQPLDPAKAAAAGLTPEQLAPYQQGREPEAPFRTGGSVLDKVLGTQVGTEEFDTERGSRIGMQTGAAAYDEKQKNIANAEKALVEARARAEQSKLAYDEELARANLKGRAGDVPIIRALQQKHKPEQRRLEVDEAEKKLEAARRAPLPTQSQLRSLAERVPGSATGMAASTVAGAARFGLGALELGDYLTSRALGTKPQSEMFKDANKAVDEAADGVNQYVSQQLFRADPAREKEIGTQLVDGVVSTAVFAAGGAVAKGLGLSVPAAVAILGALPQAEQQYQQAAQAANLNPGYAREWLKNYWGIDVGEDAANNIVRWAMFAGGLGIGASEAVPIAHLFERLEKVTGGKLTQYLGIVGAQAGEEGVQNWGQQLAQNAMERGLLDPNKDISDELLSSFFVGAAAGGITTGVMAVPATLRSKVADIRTFAGLPGDPVPVGYEYGGPTWRAAPELAPSEEPTVELARARVGPGGPAAAPRVTIPPPPEEPAAPPPAEAPPAEPEKAPEQAREDEVLRRYGYTDEQIAEMSPAQRKAEYDDAIAADIHVAPEELPTETKREPYEAPPVVAPRGEAVPEARPQPPPEAAGRPGEAEAPGYPPGGPAETVRPAPVREAPSRERPAKIPVREGKAGGEAEAQLDRREAELRAKLAKYPDDKHVQRIVKDQLETIAVQRRALKPVEAIVTPEYQQTGKGLLGKQAKVISPHAVTASDGTKVQVVPILVKRSALKTSFDPGYDQTVQPRERERAASKAQIREIATRLDPDLLGRSAEADRGAPLIDSNGMVISGNGRIKAIDAVRSVSTLKPNAEKYAALVTDEGGADDDILVRQIVTPMTREQLRKFAVAANAPTTLAMAAPERAMADADHLTPQILGLIADPENIAAPANRGFVRAFIGAIPASERGALVTPQGTLSAEGLTRARNAILARAYGDAGLISRITESTDDEIRSISNALVSAAPQWAKLVSDVESGRVRPEFDLTDELVEAVSQTANIRSRGERLGDFLAQIDAFSQVPEGVQWFMRNFYDPQGKRAAGVQAIARGLTSYVEEARKATNDPRLGLPEEEVTPSGIQATIEKAKIKEAEARAEARARARGAAPGKAQPPAGKAKPQAPERGKRGAFREEEPRVGRGAVPGRAAGELREPSLFHAEPGVEGKPQLVIPGTERVSPAELAKRRAAGGLKPTVPQKPMEIGLWGERASQPDLLAAQQKTEVATTPQQAFPDKVAKTKLEPQITKKAKPASQAPSLFGWEKEDERPRAKVPGGKALEGVAPAEGGRPQAGGEAERGAARGGKPRARPDRPPYEEGLFGPRGEGGGAPAVHPPEAGAPGAGRAGPGVGAKGAGVSGKPAAGGKPGAARPGRLPVVKPQEAPSVPAINYRITDETQLGMGSESVKFRDNIAAIQTLKQVEAEDRRPTPDEQRILARYVGWGGLANAFPNPETGEFKEDWKDRGDQLVSLLNKDEYAAARHSTPNAHYTSRAVIDAAWKGAQRLGFTGGLTLENSMGTGNFLGLVPDSIAGSTKFIGVELDSISARIAKLLYPQETVIQSGFQRVPLPDGEFVLSIGNPPFGSESLRFQHKADLHGLSIHNQFFLASLDALRPNGLHIAVVSRYMLDAQDKGAREKMAIKANLLGAIRLPDTAFKENARTEVVTDIVFMQRRTPAEEREMQELYNEMNKGGRSDQAGADRRTARREFLQRAPWIETEEVRDPLGGEPMPVNGYFAKHPDMVMGRLERSGTMRQKNEVNVKLADPKQLAEMLDKAVERLPQNKLNLDKEIIDRTKERFKTLSESLEISMRGLEPGHLEYDDKGKLNQIIERETPNGDFEPTRREVTPDTPWSRQLMMDAQGRWYTLEPRMTPAGVKLKIGGRLQYEKKFYPNNEVPASMRLGQAKFERVGEITRMRDLLKKQIVLETQDADPKVMERNRGQLRAAYRAYTEKNGLLNEPRNMQLLNEMPDGPLLMALESGYRPAVTAARAARTGQKVSKATAKPAAILSQRVILKYEPPTRAATPADAIAISLSETGKLDTKRIAALLDIPEDKVGEALSAGEKPLAFYDPETKTWEARGNYLSGQVRRKLAAARAAGLDNNVRELEKIQPAKWTADQVTPFIGSNWVPTKHYEDFVKHLLGVSRASVQYSALTNTYSLLTSDDITLDKQIQWGTRDMPPDAIIRGMLYSRLPRVMVPTYDQYGREVGKHEDKEKSALVVLKAREIADAFADWVFKDHGRRRELVDIYNDKFNTRMPRQHDGSHLALPGKNPTITPWRHVMNAIWRGIYERNLLLDHVVGAGKTFTAIGRIMERRRMGLSKKPMVVVPNHLVEQWAAEAYKMYPGAKVLAAGKNQFDRKNRRKLFARIATGDWDMVIVPHSSFEFIGISRETELRFLEDQLRAAREAVREAEEEHAASGMGGWRKPYTVKEAERLVSRIESRMDALRSGRRDNMLTFEQMGVDDLTVDEAHEYKNLFYSTRMTGVRGMGDKSGSQKAFDLYHKIKVLNESPTGTVVFLTGTPISNSAAEMYSMMRYLAADELRELGMEHFDSWRAQFVTAEPKWEPTEAGGIKEVTRLGRSWSNMRALMDLYQSFTDSVTQEDINKQYAEDHGGADFPIPKVAGGGRQTHVTQPTAAQSQILTEVIDGFEHLDDISDPDERNAERLRLMDRARKVSLDARAVDPRSTSKEEGGKLDAISDEVARIYKKWNADKGTQLIFLDRSVAKAKGDDKEIKRYDEWVARRDDAAARGDEEGYRRALDQLDKFDANDIEAKRRAQQGGWNAYDQIKRNLIARGIPADEIRFIQEANDDAEKRAMFDAVNSGEIRVLIGSTLKMGAGTNVQERLVGLHHGDVTWKPSDIEQREGRIIRQGNSLLAKHGKNFEVEIHNYVTERTVDAKMWDLNSEKLRMINGIRDYDGAFNMDFVDEESVGMAEIAALASGDPLLMERVKLAAEIEKLEMQERGFRRKMTGIEDAVHSAKRVIAEYPAKIEEEKAASDDMRQRFADLEQEVAKRRVTVEGKEYKYGADAAQGALTSIKQQQGDNEKGRYKVNVDGQELTNKEAINDAIHIALGDSEPFEVKIGGETYRRWSGAQRAILEKIEPAVKAASKEQPEQVVKIGRMLGANLEATVRDSDEEQAYMSLALMDDGKTIAATNFYPVKRLLESPQFIRNFLKELEKDTKDVAASRGLYMQEQLDAARKALPQLEPQLNQTSPVSEKLEAARNKLREIIETLDARTQHRAGQGQAEQWWEQPGALAGIIGERGAFEEGPPRVEPNIFAAQGPKPSYWLEQQGLSYEQAAAADTKYLNLLRQEWEAAHPNERLFDIRDISPSDIAADPARFQFRTDITGETAGKASGITEKKRIDPNKFSQTFPLVVWQDTKGKLFVVDGHHRLHAAKEVQARINPNFKVHAIVLHESDGITPRMAYDFGERRNDYRDATAGIRKMPGLNATPAEIASVQAALAREASPDEIEALPVIQRAYALGKNIPQTIERPDYGTEEYRANRIFNFGGQKVVGWPAIRDRLEERAKSFATNGMKYERRAWITTGPGGAGKSTISDPLAGRVGAAIVDADEAKPVMPEFSGGVGSNAVHEESSHLTYWSPYDDDSVLERLAIQGANMIIGKIGANPQSIRELREKLAEAGYEVNLIQLSVDPEIAFRRRTLRFLRAGRIISGGYHSDTASKHGGSTKSYYIHKGEGKFHGTVELTGNGPKPVLIDGYGTALAKEIGFDRPREGGPRYGETTEGVGPRYREDEEKIRGPPGPSAFAETAPRGWREVEAGPVIPSQQTVELPGFDRTPDVPVARDAQDYVVARGRETGVEHLVIVDSKGNVVFRGYGSAKSTGDSAKVGSFILHPTEKYVAHHNHPSGYPLSPVDVATLVGRGLSAVWAHGHDGSVHRASLTERALGALPETVESQELLQDVMYNAMEDMWPPLEGLLRLGRITEQQANQLYGELGLRALNQAGIIDYRSNVELPELGAWVGPYMYRAAQRAARRVFNGQFQGLGAGATRSTGAFRHPGDVGATFERTAGAPPKRPARPDATTSRAFARAVKNGQLTLPFPQALYGLSDIGEFFAPDRATFRGDLFPTVHDMEKRTVYGLPLNPRSALEQLKGCSFCVSYGTRQHLGPQLEQAIRLVGADQILLVDNGAYTRFKQDLSSLDPHYVDDFEKWAGDILARSPQAIAVIPDVIGGTVEQNAQLVNETRLPHDRAMPIWHLHEPISYLRSLLDGGWSHIGFGSSGDYWQVGSRKWHARIREAFKTIEDWEKEGNDVRPRIHMMRAQAMAHLYPFDSSDSTNVARNHNRFRRLYGEERYIERFAARVAEKINESASGAPAEHQAKRPHPDTIGEPNDADLIRLQDWFNANYRFAPRAKFAGFEAPAPRAPRLPHPPIQPLHETVRAAFTDPTLSTTQRLNAAIDALALKPSRALWDKIIDLHRLQRAAEIATGQVVPENLDSYLAASIYPGRVGERVKDIQKLFAPIYDEMAARGIGRQELNDFLQARHAGERNAQIRLIDPANDAGSGMTDAEAANILNMPAARRADFDAVAAFVDKVVKHNRDLMEREGLEHAKTILQWSTTYKYYVPLKGAESAEDEHGSPSLGEGFSVRGPESRRALGRFSKAGDVLTNLLDQSIRTTVRSEKNRVGKAFLRFAQKYASPLYKLGLAETRRRINPSTGLVETVWVTTPAQQESAFAIKVAGKTYYVDFHSKDAGLLLALKGLGMERLPPLGRMIAAFTRQYSAFQTARNPEFVLTNLVRDLQDAGFFMTAEQQKGFKRAFLKHLLNGRALFGAISGQLEKTANPYGQLYEEWRAAGGKISMFGYKDLQTIFKEVESELAQRTESTAKTAAMMLPRLPLKAVKLFEALSDVTESTTRLAVYAAAREVGLTQAQAAKAARNMTVDFNASGKYGPWMKALWAFSGPQIQGTVNLVRRIRKSPKTAFIAGVAIPSLSFGLTMWNLWAAGDDPDDKQNLYAKRKYWEREKNIIIHFPGFKNALKLPIGYGLQSFWMLGENLALAAMGKITPWEALGNWIGTTAKAFNPLGGEGSAFSLNFWMQAVMPTMLEPLYELGRNRNWLNRNIHPEEVPWTRGMPHSWQSKVTTSPVAESIAQWMNSVSGGTPFKKGTVDLYPDDLEYIWNFTLGGFGKFMLNNWGLAQDKIQGVDTPIEKLPFVRRFIAPGGTLDVERSEFYEKSHEAKEQVGSLKKAVEAQKIGQSVEEARQTIRELAPKTGMREGPRGGYSYGAETIFRKANEQLQKLRLQERNIRRDPNVSRSERAHIIEENRKQQQLIMRNARRAYQQMQPAAP